MGNLIEPYKGKLSAILLMGPPGSGKRDLGKFLAQSRSQFYLSTGEIFRSLPIQSPAGQLYYAHASQGELLPDDAAIEIWQYYVDGLIATNLYNPEDQDLLLDGLPKTGAQAQLLEEFIQVRHIIVLENNDREELIRRMQRRARLAGRVEQIDEEVLLRRIEIYEQETRKLFDYYPNHLISRVDGTQKQLEVVRDVLVRLSHLLSRGAP